MNFFKLVAVWVLFFSATQVYSQTTNLKDVTDFSARFWKLRETEGFVSIISANDAALKAEKAQIDLERTLRPGRTREDPEVTTEATLVAQYEALLKSCPQDIVAILQEKKLPKTIALAVQRDVPLLARCLFQFDVLYSGLLHWNELRLAPGSADKDDSATIDYGVLKKNRAVNRIQLESGATALELQVFVKPAQLIMLQKILDQSWNVDAPVKIIAKQYSGKHALRLEYHPGALPAANGIAGTVIRYDDRTEFEKVMAHELGHVLGFRDCYYHLWDASTKTATYFELDRSNIMCSLQGKVLPMHHEALKQAYLAP